MKSLRLLAAESREASRHLALLSTEAKNELLIEIGKNILKKKKFLLLENAKDMRRAKQKKLPEGLLDRLLLTEERLENIAKDIWNVAALPDPVGRTLEERVLPSGLELSRVTVPIGVIGMIYEARPNVTVDAASLALKSGNAIILRTGADALFSSRALVKVIRETLAVADGLNAKRPLHHAVQFIDSPDRKYMRELLSLRGLIDLIIPRGGKGLIDFVVENSKIPVIETGASVVHTFVDESANIDMAVKIVTNAKLRRISICNTLDTLLIHQKTAEKFLPAFIKHLKKHRKGLEIRADEPSSAILKKIFRKLKIPRGTGHGRSNLIIKKAKPDDFGKEFLAPILAIKTVKDLDAALHHLETHSLKHSEAIVTENRRNAERFLRETDAACVYWNTSTQFSDGAQFGLGAEIGISTQKLHARGPFALEALTSYKWVIRGKGQTRPT